MLKRIAKRVATSAGRDRLNMGSLQKVLLMIGVGVGSSDHYNFFPDTNKLYSLERSYNLQDFENVESVACWYGLYTRSLTRVF